MRKGREFELAYEWLYKMDESKYLIESPAYVIDKISESRRELDVLISWNDSHDITRRIGVECRDRKSSEDVTWIEQLKTKKEDLELDYLIATTTKKFTKPAITKSKHHGIIIEQAELLTPNLIEKLTETFFVDMFFVNYKVNRIAFLQKGDKDLTPFQEFITKMHFIELNELLHFINYELYFNIEPHTIMGKLNLNTDWFLEKNKDKINFTHVHFFETAKDDIYNNYGLKSILINFDLIPFKLSLPLNKSLSTFDGEIKSNKNYKAKFGFEDDSIEIGYLNNKIHCKVRLKDREYFRLVTSNMHINTIFPSLLNDYYIDIKNYDKTCIGKFDLRNIFKIGNIE